ncbi:MAG: septum formation initiator family protein [Parcubacteria group bacterium]|nr:septum formation initiator family protein [Parcubacteria group bacterium]
MKMSKERHNVLYRFFSSGILFVFCIVLLLFISYSLIREYVRKNSVGREIDELKKQILSLETDTGHLSKMVQYFQTQSFIEDEARLNLGLSKPGESVLIIPQKTKEEMAEIDPQQRIENKNFPDQNNPEKWLHYFIGKKR